MEDETNDDVENPRNRVRHVILPELDRAAGGATRPAIARAAALVREDGQWLDELGQDRFEALATSTPDGVEIDAIDLGRRAASRSSGGSCSRPCGETADGREIGLDHVEAVLDDFGGKSWRSRRSRQPRGTSARKAGLNTAEGSFEVILFSITP